MQQFLGLASNYCCFVKDFAVIVKLLHRLTKERDTFLWTDAGVTCQKWLHLSRPDFTCLLTRFLLLQELGEACSLRDNKFSPPYLLRLNYCSFVRETVVFKGYAKRFSAARESCVHAIAFRVTPIDSPNCDTKPTYHGILR